MTIRPNATPDPFFTRTRTLIVIAAVIIGCESDMTSSDVAEVSLNIVPHAVTLRPQQQTAFAVSLRGSGGEVVSEGRMMLGQTYAGEGNNLQIGWSATGGVIAADGRYAASSTPGTYYVIVESGMGMTDTAIVAVSAGAAASVLSRVVLTPETIGLEPGAEQQFNVYGRMSDGDSVEVNPSFDATGGSVTAEGLYTAGSEDGTFHVIATDPSGLADTSVVWITSNEQPSLQSVTLEPSSVDLFTGTTQQFQTYGQMSNGETVSVAASYTATNGTISSDGWYTAPSSPGVFEVVAVAEGGLADTATVNVSEPPATLALIELSPTAGNIDVGEQLQFGAIGLMSDGDTVPVSVEYAAEGGTISPNGLYTAGDVAGTYNVVATETGAGFTDTSVVQVNALPATLTGLVLSPASTSLYTGDVRQFTAQGVMDDGTTVPVNVSYSASGGSISSDGLFLAGNTPGNYWVAAVESGGNFTDTATVTVAARPVNSDVRAFPSAEGYGAYATGGRGGRVIHVTNLANSGPGSFRDAATASGPRTIVFDVGGTIELSSPVTISNGDLTIAGQTAPGGGITLRGDGLAIRGSNVIIRYIRVRRGGGGSIPDGIQIGNSGGSNAQNIILDHVSASWSGGDENVSVMSATKVTVQWSIVSEGLAAKGMRCCGSFGTDVSVHHNLFVHNHIRNPNVNFAPVPAGQTPTNRMDQRYNVVHNWGAAPRNMMNTRCNACQSLINLVGNVNTAGPSTNSGKRDQIAQGLPENNPANVRLYHTGNLINGKSASNASIGPNLTVVDAPFPVSSEYTIAPDDIGSVFERVLNGAGVTVPMRDAVDIRVIGDVRSGGGKIVGSVPAGGWPNLPAGTPPVDTDRDGMTDAWESAVGLNPNDASDGPKDRNGDGYTNLEEYLNSLVGGT